MALGLSRHAEVAQRIGLPQAARPVTVPPPHPKNAKIPDPSDVPPSSPAGSLFDGSDDDDDDVPKLALNDASAGTSGPSPSVSEPTPVQVPAATLSSEVPSTGISTATPSERPRPVKTKGKGRPKAKVAATAPKPNSSQTTNSRPPVTLSSRQQAAYYVNKRTPSWAGGQGSASTFIPGNASVSSSATHTTPSPANPTTSNNGATRNTGRPSAGASRNTIQPSGKPTVHPTPNQPSNASISSGPPANPRTQATQSIPPNKFVSINTVTSAPTTSTLPGSSSNHISPTSQTSYTPSTSQCAIPQQSTPTSVAPPAGRTTATAVPSAQPATSANPTVPPSGANATTTPLPKYGPNGSFPPNIPVCSVPAGFVSPPPPSLCLPPPPVFHNYTPAQLVQMAQAQSSSPFPTQPAPLNCVSPTWLSKPLPRRSASSENIHRAQAQQNTPRTSTPPVAPPLRRAASEQTTRSPHFPVHAQQAQGAYNSNPPPQPVSTRQVHVQPGQHSYGAPQTRPAPSVPVAQAPRGNPRVVSASKPPQPHIPPPAQNYAPRPANNSDSFSVDAWRVNSPTIHPPPLVRAQSYHGSPATQSPPVRQTAMAGPSRPNTRPAVPSNLSFVYTMPPAPTAHKRRMEEEDDGIQEIPPPHKRFRGQ